MIEPSPTIAFIVMWILLPICLFTIAMGYSLWTWAAVLDIIASIRDKRRFFPIEHETFTWIVFHLVVLGIVALLLLGQVSLR